MRKAIAIGVLVVMLLTFVTPPPAEAGGGAGPAIFFAWLISILLISAVLGPHYVVYPCGSPEMTCASPPPPPPVMLEEGQWVWIPNVPSLPPPEAK